MNKIIPVIDIIINVFPPSYVPLLAKSRKLAVDSGWSLQ